MRHGILSESATIESLRVTQAYMYGQMVCEFGVVCSLRVVLSFRALCCVVLCAADNEPLEFILIGCAIGAHHAEALISEECRGERADVGDISRLEERQNGLTNRIKEDETKRNG